MNKYFIYISYLKEQTKKKKDEFKIKSITYFIGTVQYSTVADKTNNQKNLKIRKKQTRRKQFLNKCPYALNCRSPLPSYFTIAIINYEKKPYLLSKAMSIINSWLLLGDQKNLRWDVIGTKCVLILDLFKLPYQGHFLFPL